MGKYIFILFIISITSCNILSNIKYEKMLGGAEIYNYDFGEIENHEDIARFIDHYILYENTAEPQSPEQTILKGTAGCLGKAILYMNIAYLELGIEMSIILVDSARTVKDGGLVNHSEVYYDGVCYSVDTGKEEKMDIGYIYSFYEVFK